MSFIFKVMPSMKVRLIQISQKVPTMVTTMRFFRTQRQLPEEDITDVLEA